MCLLSKWKPLHEWPDISINFNCKFSEYFKIDWFYFIFCVCTIYWNTDMDTRLLSESVRQEWRRSDSNSSIVLRGWRVLLKQLRSCVCVSDAAWCWVCVRVCVCFWCRVVLGVCAEVGLWLSALCVCKTAAGSPIVWLGNSAEISVLCLSADCEYICIMYQLFIRPSNGQHTGYTILGFVFGLGYIKLLFFSFFFWHLGLWKQLLLHLFEDARQITKIGYLFNL